LHLNFPTENRSKSPKIVTTTPDQLDNFKMLADAIDLTHLDDHAIVGTYIALHSPPKINFNAALYNYICM
jgi:hypothetical protein